MSSPVASLSWPKTTARLTIRPATAEDVGPTWRYRSLPEVAEWITAAPPDLEEYTARFLHVPRLEKTLVVELGEEIIGDLMLGIEDAWAQAEIEEQAKGVQAELGWAFDPRQGGRGYATEAVTELVRLCFEELGLRRVVGSCFADNVASWRLMERIGMRRELHAVKESLHRSGRWLDGFGYALLAEEWHSRATTGRQVSAGTVDRDQRHDWWGAVLDSPDPQALARFYAELLGWRVTSDETDFCTLNPDDGVGYLACQRSPDYVRPVWPNQAGEQQMMLHLDFEVTDLERAVAHATGLGAALLPHQPQDDVRVMADPDGHPFCLYTS